MGCLFFEIERKLAGEFFLVGDGTGGARRTPAAIAELTNIEFEFSDSAAQGVAMHSELPRGAALVALVFFENSCDETLLEFSDRFGIKNVALIHLVYECFQLIFHRISLSVLFKRPDYKSVYLPPWRGLAGCPRRK